MSGSPQPFVYSLRRFALKCCVCGSCRTGKLCIRIHRPRPAIRNKTIRNHASPGETESQSIESSLSVWTGEASNRLHQPDQPVWPDSPAGLARPARLAGLASPAGRASRFGWSVHSRQSGQTDRSYQSSSSGWSNQSGRSGLY